MADTNWMNVQKVRKTARPNYDAHDPCSMANIYAVCDAAEKWLAHRDLDVERDDHDQCAFCLYTDKLEEKHS